VTGDDTMRLIENLKAEVARIEAALELKMTVGETYPGKSQAPHIKAIISELQNLIESLNAQRL
jgi:hypothetical protein